MIPLINFTTDGHDRKSLSSCKHASLNFKDKLKNQTLTEDSKQNLKTKLESEIHCQCNGTPSTNTGGFLTWGCTPSVQIQQTDFEWKNKVSFKKSKT